MLRGIGRPKRTNSRLGPDLSPTHGGPQVTPRCFSRAKLPQASITTAPPGSHLGVLLQPVSPIDTIHGLLLTGGGPMGLAAVAGAVRYLEEHKTGFDWGIPNVRVPIVVGASPLNSCPSVQRFI